MADIGVVCEGSHDFCYLKPIIEYLLTSRGHTVGRIEALQPKVDATSRQIDGGGYQTVQQWLVANKGIGLDKFFSTGLFASSNTYDAIIVHLDGDVPDISKEYADSAFPSAFPTVSARINAVQSWIMHLLKPRGSHSKNILTAIPILQMEAWVLAGLGSNSRKLETKNYKSIAKRILDRRFIGRPVDHVVQAATQAIPIIDQMRSSAKSFDVFAEDFFIRF